MEEKCMLVLIVLIYSGRLVAVPPGGMMSVLWPGSQPAPHKHGEIQKRGKVLEQIINSCELPNKSINVMPGFIYVFNIGYLMLLSGLGSQPAPHKNGEIQRRGKVLFLLLRGDLCEVFLVFP